MEYTKKYFQNSVAKMQSNDHGVHEKVFPDHCSRHRLNARILWLSIIIKHC